MKQYSYHIFHYPFKWTVKGKENALFSEQIDMNGIDFCELSMWERSPEQSEQDNIDIYNEKNYYYKFVHNILYDTLGTGLELMRHFERREPKTAENVTYNIKVKGRSFPYKLKVEAINLNFYSTGVGILSFFLSNNDEYQSSQDDILKINQFGRRVMPPFFDDKKFRSEIAEYISIEGLSGGYAYKEDFNSYTINDCWKSASFINHLIEEAAGNIKIAPVIDDRMFVCSWYKNDDLARIFQKDENAFTDDEKFSEFWYKYVFVDGTDMTCQNNKMKKEILENQTYNRWQKWFSLYGVSRYSMVYLTNHGVPQFLLNYFITIYSRMIELVLVQRASILRFSEEVTFVSALRNHSTAVVSERANSLYKEYLQFLNQIYFREVTAQDQGIELYNMLHRTLSIGDYIEDLDGEIEELHDYISLKIENKRSRNGEWLNILAAIFLPATLATGLFGMNPFPKCVYDWTCFWWQIALIVALSAIAIYIIRKKSK